MADLDPELAVLRDGAAGAEPMTALSPAEVRARVVAGNALCEGGPKVDITDVPREEDRAPVGLRIYEGDHTPVATMVYAHGGGWVTGDLDYADEFCRHLSAGAGLRVVSVDYRLAPEHPYPQPLADVADAWSWVRERYDGPWAVGGDSAGGNLVAALSHRWREANYDRPAFQMLLYPVLGAPDGTDSYRTRARAFPTGAAEMRWFFEHYTSSETLAAAPADLLPLTVADLTGLPPTLLVVAGHDPLHDEGVAYAERVHTTGVPTEVLDHGDLCHGFLRFTGASAAARDARTVTVAAARSFAQRFALGRHDA